MSKPVMEEKNGKKILMVQGKPFIMLAGEVHNSNSSSAEYMEQVWQQAKTLGMNTLLLPVSWEMVEPEEGTFDFAIVDQLIGQARKYGMKIQFLWFGAWKNAQCYYAPEWVKKDTQRFARAQMVKGQNFARLESFHGMSYTSLSYLCEETKKADARAFAELMKHIRSIDETDHTVIMIQVENETGVMGAAREQSDIADVAFNSQVPSGLVAYMRSHMDTLVEDVKKAVESGMRAGKENGTWAEVFGPCAEEIFSAYYISSYVNEVAAAGRAEYDLPMSANCWLDKGAKAGEYPSGGPVRRVMEVWQYAAPQIDVLAPDIYVPNFMEICNAYTENGNPLAIPETAVHAYAGPREMYCVGHYHALCYSPFGFEDLGKPFNNSQAFLFGVDTEDPALSTPQSVEEYGFITRNLAQMAPMLAEAYGTGRLQAVSRENQGETMMNFEKYGIMCMFEIPMLQRKDGACMVLQIAENEFYIMVVGGFLNFISTDQEKPFVDVSVLEDGTFIDGKWHAYRRLNGDEVAMQMYEEPTLLHLKLVSYN